MYTTICTLNDEKIRTFTTTTIKQADLKIQADCNRMAYKKTNEWNVAVTTDKYGTEVKRVYRVV